MIEEFRQTLCEDVQIPRISRHRRRSYIVKPQTRKTAHLRILPGVTPQYRDMYCIFDTGLARFVIFLD